MKLYRVCTKQNLECAKFSAFWGKLVGYEPGYLYRGDYFYYCNSEQEAIDRYIKQGRGKYTGVIHGWGDWLKTSNNFDITAENENWFKIISNEVVCIDPDDPTIKQLRDKISAEDFKAWLFDADKYKIVNIIAE